MLVSLGGWSTKPGCQIHFIYWRNMILFYTIIKREHKKTRSKWRKLCSLCLGWKGKIKTSKIDYYTFHQTFVFSQNQLLPSLQQHWCWRLPGSGYHCHTELKVCRLYLDNSLFSFWCLFWVSLFRPWLQFYSALIMHPDWQPDLAALTAGVAGGHSPSLTHNSSFREQLWSLEKGM